MWVGLAVMAAICGCGRDMDRQVAAMVNNRCVSMSALEEATRGLSVNEATEAWRRAWLKEALGRLIEEELILAEAERLGLTVKSEERDRLVEAFAGDFPGDGFIAVSTREYVDPEAWEERLRRNALILKTTRTVLRHRVKVEPGEWNKFFQRALKMPDGRVRIRVRYVTSDTEAGIKRALKLIKTGRDVARAARDRIKNRAVFAVGEPCWIYPHLLPGEMAGAVRGVPPGRCGDVVKSEYGYTVFQVLAVEKPEKPDPLQRMACLRKEFMEIQTAAEYARWMAELKAAADIRINPALTARLDSADIKAKR